MKKSIGEKLFDIFMYGCIGIGILLILYPLYFILIASISDQNLVANGQVFLFPKEIQFVDLKGFLKMICFFRLIGIRFYIRL